MVKNYAEMRKPTGKKDFPAKTCKELAESQPDLPSGMLELFCSLVKILDMHSIFIIDHEIQKTLMISP